MEKKATQQARTFNPANLPFSTTVEEWDTWVNNSGQWMFIEKSVAAAVSTMLGCSREEAFAQVGQWMLDWLTRNTAPKPRTIWRITFAKCRDLAVSFGVYNNQCFIFMPRQK